MCFVHGCIASHVANDQLHQLLRIPANKFHTYNLKSVYYTLQLQQHLYAALAKKKWMKYSETVNE